MIMKLFCCSRKKLTRQKIACDFFAQKGNKILFWNNLKSKERQKFIGHKFRNQKYLVGINIIPSGNFNKFFTKFNPFLRLLANKDFDITLFPDLLCGHTSIISFDKHGVLNKKNSRGYAPNFIDSMKIIISNYFGYLINVPGIIYEESDSVIWDPVSIKIMTSVHYKTYILFNKLLDYTGNMGYFSFNPRSGFNERFDDFDGKNSNNCTTFALRRVLSTCSKLLNEKEININDKYNLNGLKLELSLIIDQIVKRSIKKGSSMGVLGHVYREAFEI